MKIVRLCLAILICTGLVSAVALMQDDAAEATPSMSPAGGTPYIYQLTCDDTAQGIEGTPETTVTVSCPSDCAPAPVWGTDIYTLDSSVCSAARHAGVITASGGTFTLRLFGDPGSFTGTEQNGITSSNYGSYPASFEVAIEEAAIVKASCDMTAQALPGDADTEWLIECPENCTDGAIWGTGTYTDDSAVCLAAQHAGVIGAEGGEFRLWIAPGQPRYEGSEQNGITSDSYLEWERSYMLVPTKPPAILVDGSSTAAGILSGDPGTVYLVECPPNFALGSVWGTRTYTDDSALCTAALHAGVITMEGGRFTVIIAPGQSLYKASTRNGVTTMEWGEWGRSYVLEDEARGEQVYYDALAVMSAEATETR